MHHWISLFWALRYDKDGNILKHSWYNELYYPATQKLQKQLCIRGFFAKTSSSPVENFLPVSYLHEVSQCNEFLSAVAAKNNWDQKNSDYWQYQ